MLVLEGMQVVPWNLLGDHYYFFETEKLISDYWFSEKVGSSLSGFPCGQRSYISPENL